MNVITKSVQLPDGRTITIETGKVAKQADGAAVLRMGNTVLLATVCAAKDAVPGTDFMPLQVDYREQYSAAGRFPGGFTKREGKASDNEILTSRLVDRALRPLFPSNYHAEVYVQVMLLSADGVDQPDALAGFAASAAMACSDIPFEYAISEVRVARINGEFVIDPTFQQMADADMDLMVAATKDNIMMVEGEMKEVSEQDLIDALKAASEAIKPMCELQEELSKELGTNVKREYDHEINDEELREQIKNELYQPVYDVNKQALEKHARHDAFDKILVDAPCSGIGLIRRKPDIKYNKENADFENLQKIQLDILDSVCQSLRKGGIITYSTCTIMAKENFEVVEKFLASHPNFEQVLLDHERKDIVKDGCILITPELYESDGFFISQFRKISE
mgnify:CR=1 FL=1